MKIFKVDYGWSPSSPESSIVLADNVDVAMALVEGSGLHSKITWVDEKPKELHYGTPIEARITLIKEEEGIIYTGEYCC